MKVLLVSPIDPDTPGKLKFLAGGENTYTRTLLANPPPGVSYVYYHEALKQGKITYSNLQKPFGWLMKLRFLPPDAGIQSLIIKDHFDLIHCHGYCLQVSGYTGPVVLSDSSSNFLFLKGYLKWSDLRINLSYTLRKLMVRIFGIYDQNCNLKEANLIVWSHFAKKLHQAFGIPAGKIFVIPPGIEKSCKEKTKRNGFNLLFVGTWFKRKGGDLVVKAYQQIKKTCPNLKLTLIGELPNDITLPDDTRHYNYLPREKILAEIFPKTDLLVLAPYDSEGYGLIIEEAFSFGIPAVVTGIGALPEIVEDKISGFIIKPGDLEELIAKITQLINNGELLTKMGNQAYKRWQKKFDIRKTNQQLKAIYQRALFLKSE